MRQEDKLTIRGQFGEIRRLCEFVGEGARQAGFSEDGVFQVQLACDEACTNIIEHTYGSEDQGNITASYRISGADFTVTIEDSGQRFDPNEIPPPPVPPDPDDEYNIKIGGLGVFFMRELMDEVSFTYESGRGNVLKMVKQLPDKEDK